MNNIINLTEETFCEVIISAIIKCEKSPLKLSDLFNCYKSTFFDDFFLDLVVEGIVPDFTESYKIIYNDEKLTLGDIPPTPNDDFSRHVVLLLKKMVEDKRIFSFPIRDNTYYFSSKKSRFQFQNKFIGQITNEVESFYNDIKGHKSKFALLLKNVKNIPGWNKSKQYKL